MDLLALALNDLDEGPEQEACADAVGDRVGERHENDGEERWKSDLEVVPLDAGNLGHHEETNEHERRSCSLVRNHCHEWREEGSEEEGSTSNDGCQTRTCTFTNTGCRLDERSVRGDGTSTTGNSRKGVNHEDRGRVRWVSLVIQEVSLSTHSNHGAHGVEEVGQQEGEHKEQNRDDSDLLNGTEQREVSDEGEVRYRNERVRNRRNVQVPALRVLRGLAAERSYLLNDDRNDGSTEDRPEHCTLDLAGGEKNDRREAQNEHEERPRVDGSCRTKLNRGSRLGARYVVEHCRNGDETCVDQTDECDEETDTNGDGSLEARRNCTEDSLAEAGEHEDQDDETLEDDEAHAVCPGHAWHLDDGVRNERVDSQTSSDCDWVVCYGTHGDRHDRCDEGGCCRDERDTCTWDRWVTRCQLGAEEGAGGVGGEAEDKWVEDDDVAHREERDETTADFTAHGRTTL